MSARILFASVFFGAVVAGMASTTTSSKDTFAFFIFCSRWPGGECHISGSCIPPQQNTSWLIHGIWPQGENGAYPSYCKGEAWDTSAVSSIESQLDEWWPNMETGATTPSFWDHEWTKHGTCAKPQFTTILPFFQKGLALRSAYDIGEIVANAGVVASDRTTVKVSDITGAIQKGLGYTPGLQCTAGSDDTSKTYVQWLATCYTKEFELMDCPSNMGSGWNCPTEAYYATTDGF